MRTTNSAQMYTVITLFKVLFDSNYSWHVNCETAVFSVVKHDSYHPLPPRLMTFVTVKAVILAYNVEDTDITDVSYDSYLSALSPNNANNQELLQVHM